MMRARKLTYTFVKVVFFRAGNRFRLHVDVADVLENLLTA